MFTRPGNATYSPIPATVGNTPQVDPGITSLAQLNAISTVNLVPPIIKIYVDYSFGTLQTYTLQADGLGQHPNDYDAVANNKSWHKAGNA